MTAETTLSVPHVRDLLERHGEALLRLAAASLRHTLATGQPLAVDPAAHAPELAAHGASFVTLRRKDEMREIRSPSELLDAVFEWGRKGLTLQRYKGLGEMKIGRAHV